MAKCDLCGGDCAAHDLAQLLTQYQAAGVRDVCPTCRRWADKTKGALLDQIAPQMRAAVEARKGEPQLNARWKCAPERPDSTAPSLPT